MLLINIQPASAFHDDDAEMKVCTTVIYRSIRSTFIRGVSRLCHALLLRNLSATRRLGQRVRLRSTRVARFRRKHRSIM